MKTNNLFLAILIIGLLFTSCNNNKKVSSEEKAMRDSIANAKAEQSKKFNFDPDKFYIYLTFDDGPQLPGTKICKNIVEESNIKGTFFMLGFHKETAGRRAQTLIDSINNNPSFILANHSYTHGFRNQYSKFYKHPDSAVADFLKAQESLGTKHKIIRLPGRNTWVVDGKIHGEKSSNKVATKLDSLGFSIVGWDLEWRIKGNIPEQSATKLAQEVDDLFESDRTNAANALVILTHDRMFAKPQYSDSLRKFISILKKNDKYVFETLNNYPGITK